MFRRQPGKPAKQDASSYSRLSAVSDSAWIAQDRARNGLEHTYERTSFTLRKRLIWPLQDRAGTFGAPARTLAVCALFLLAAAAGVAGLIWAAPDGSGGDAVNRVALASPAAVEVKDAVEKPAEPTLHGATPVFKPPAGSASSEVDPAKAVVKSAPAETDSAAAEASEPAAGSSSGAESSAATSSAARPAAESEVDGPPAGPKAIAVAREFSDAFVVYETGGLDSGVRKAFGATATPELSRALLQRPPRLPANVEVPRAKVLNVVAGPSHSGVYTVSVSLLRVGSTSELRLDMEKLKGKEWRVTNVLG